VFKTISNQPPGWYSKLFGVSEHLFHEKLSDLNVKAITMLVRLNWLKDQLCGFTTHLCNLFTVTQSLGLSRDSCSLKSLQARKPLLATGGGGKSSLSPVVLGALRTTCKALSRLLP